MSDNFLRMLVSGNDNNDEPLKIATESCILSIANESVDIPIKYVLKNDKKSIKKLLYNGNLSGGEIDHIDEHLFSYTGPTRKNDSRFYSSFVNKDNIEGLLRNVRVAHADHIIHGLEIYINHELRKRKKISPVYIEYDKPIGVMISSKNEKVRKECKFLQVIYSIDEKGIDKLSVKITTYFPVYKKEKPDRPHQFIDLVYKD